MAVLKIAETHGLIRDLVQSKPNSREDRSGIDISFSDPFGRKFLQVKTSYEGARKFRKRRSGAIPVIWVGKSSPQEIALRLAERFPSLKRLPELMVTLGE